MIYTKIYTNHNADPSVTHRIVPPIRSARWAAVVRVLREECGRAPFDEEMFSRLEDLGLSRDRAITTVEELADAMIVTVRDFKTYFFVELVCDFVPGPPTKAH